MARKSGFVRRHGVMRRETLWIGIAPTSTTLSAASTAVLFTGFSSVQLGLRPFTIVRTRGVLHLGSDQQVATENYSASLGMSIVSEQALAVGVTAVPTPETDRESDLFHVYESLAGRFAFGSTIAFMETGHFKDWDSKAMRKVEEGSDIAIVVETTSGSSGAIIHKSGRMLVKLH